MLIMLSTLETIDLDRLGETWDRNCCDRLDAIIDCGFLTLSSRFLSRMYVSCCGCVLEKWENRLVG